MKVINRIKASKDFARAIRNGKTYHSESFRLHTYRTTNEHIRVGISVSSKLGNAVVRSRSKRQIRAMCRELINFCSNSLDIVIIAKASFLQKSFDENKRVLKELLEKQVGLTNEEKH